jgi:hypothetical protein
VYKTVLGEWESVRVLSLQQQREWRKEQLLNITEGYEPKNPYNADVTGHSSGFQLTRKSCNGGKNSKETITGLLPCNTSGTYKFPSLVIGNSKNHLCFRNFRKLLIKYVANRKVWIT